MTAARDHIREAEKWGDSYPPEAIAHALIAIATTLADMADEEANTAPQPRMRDYSKYPPPNLLLGSTVRDVDLASPADGKNPE